jgi:hypothetical protein
MGPETTVSMRIAQFVMDYCHKRGLKAFEMYQSSIVGETHQSGEARL